MAIRDELAKFCTTMTFNALPDDVVQHTKLCLMDEIWQLIVGPTLFSEDYPDIIRFVKKLGGIEESSIVGLRGKYPCLNAALANTAVGETLASDAMHKSTMIHVPASLFPATIAVAERQKASGAELILAIVLGTEVMARVGISLGARNALARGFHPTSICAPFGCAAAAGKLIRLSESELAEAFSIAAVQAAGSSVWAGAVYPSSWSFQIARAAQSGVLAAMLAQIGYRGVDRIFEDQRGFLTSYSGSADPKKLTDRLGESYEIKELIHKRFGIGVYIITGVETLLDMLQRYEITADDIEEMTVKLASVVIPFVGFPEYPENRAATRVSARYVLAVTAHIRDRITYSLEFSDAQNREDPRVVDLFNRINIVGDPELDKVFPEKKSCIVTIRTRDGRQFSKRNDGPFKGEPENPLSQEDIETKFTRLTTLVLRQERTSQIISSIRQLDRLDDVSKLVDLLVS